MSVILSIETSTTVCSATLARNDNEIAVDKVCYEPQNHASKLPVFLEEIINFARRNDIMPDAVAVSAGPGSYTGLRIGVSSAKGLCYALGVPLIAVDTLQTIVVEAIKRVGDDILYCPMIDARRMEVYTALFDGNAKRLTEVEAKIIDENSFREVLEEGKVVFCGNGAGKCRQAIRHPNAVFLDDIHPLSSNMLSVASDKLKSGAVEDTAYFEPFYLKEFVGTKPKPMIKKMKSNR